MIDILGWLVVTIFFLSFIGVVDVTIDVSPHDKNEKVICVRGKAG